MHAETAVSHRRKNDDAITAYHKVHSEENESRLWHRHAVVVQDLNSVWVQSYPPKNTTVQEMMDSLQKFVRPVLKSGIIHTDNSLEFICACLVFTP